MKRFFLGGFAIAATLAVLGSTTAPTASASVARHRSGRDFCAGSANARVMKGTSKWTDPNTLTRKQAAAREARGQRILRRNGIRPLARPNGSVRIRVHFHGITDRGGHGFVTKGRFKRQIKVLNKAYSGHTSPNAADTPFRFRLASIDRVAKNRWYNASPLNKRGRKDLREMKRALRVGDSRDLNVYTIGFGNSPLLGFATFPTDYKRFPGLDGIVLLSESLPGGNASGGPGAVFNQGDTATHEIGHWLNLYHTFQGGCSRLNDYVTDTPKQDDGNNVFVCDPTLNTCPPFGSKSKDPIHNFMNYVDDPCMNQFTRGQRERMNTAWYIRQALSH
ncbi:MAG TPA: zinc metalloprotease [Nocardioidaceae bacterium]|nr:zinc metalloprotease [Nocardioidaceae bacterium]